MVPVTKACFLSFLYLKAIELNPNDYNNWLDYLRLSSCYERINDKKKAKEYNNLYRKSFNNLGSKQNPK
jgi:hypothetical protein